MPQLPMGFLEHAHSTRHLLHAKQTADLQWWCARLAGASLEPLLETDYPRVGRANMGQNQGDIVKVWSSSSAIVTSLLFITAVITFDIITVVTTANIASLFTIIKQT